MNTGYYISLPELKDCIFHSVWETTAGMSFLLFGNSEIEQGELILLPFDLNVTDVFKEMETGRWVHGQKAK